jgi:hypothetical protein
VNLKSRRPRPSRRRMGEVCTFIRGVGWFSSCSEGGDNNGYHLLSARVTAILAARHCYYKAACSAPPHSPPAAQTLTEQDAGDMLRGCPLCAIAFYSCKLYAIYGCAVLLCYSIVMGISRTAIASCRLIWMALASTLKALMGGCCHYFRAWHKMKRR